MAYDSYYVREEDGTSHFLLEDGSGALILETAVEITTSAAAAAAGARQRARQQQLRRIADDEDALLLILTQL